MGAHGARPTAPRQRTPLMTSHPWRANSACLARMGHTMPGDMPRAPVAKRMILWVKSVRKPGQLLEWAYGVCIGLGVGEGDGYGRERGS